MRRPILLALVASAATLAAQSPQAPTPRAPRFTVVEATIREMQRAMQNHRVTSRELVTQYLTRIAV